MGEAKSVAKSVMRSIRIPSSLDGEILKIDKATKLDPGETHSVTNAYLYFLQLGLRVHAYHSNNTESKGNAKNMLDSILNKDDIMDSLNELETSSPGLYNALLLAIEFKLMKRGRRLR